MEENRNVFQLQDVSSIPIFDIDPFYVPFSLREPIHLENLNSTESISDQKEIEHVVINFQTRQLEVWIRAVAGEPYTLRISQGPQNHVLHEHTWLHYSNSPQPVTVNLEEGFRYTITLLDNHNIPQHTFQFVSPTDFIVVQTPIMEFTHVDGGKGKGDDLDDTSDFPIILLFLLALGVSGVFLLGKIKQYVTEQMEKIRFQTPNIETKEVKNND